MVTAANRTDITTIADLEKIESLEKYKVRKCATLSDHSKAISPMLIPKVVTLFYIILQAVAPRLIGGLMTLFDGFEVVFHKWRSHFCPWSL